MGYDGPNYTQIPNVLIDEQLLNMKEAEIKVTLAIARKTFGWHKERDKLSLSQLMELTGLSRQGVLNGIEAGIARGTINREPAGQSFYYKLVVNEVDQLNKPTSQRSRPVLVNEVDRLSPKLVNEVDTQKKVSKDKEKENVSSLSSKQKQKPSSAEYMPGLPMPGYKQRSAKPDATAKARLPLVEKLIDIWAVRSLTDDPDYDGTELGECHKIAEKLLRDGETAQSLDVHYKAYLADDWRNPVVSPAAFARYISQVKATIGSTNGTAASKPNLKQWCLREFGTDSPIVIGIPMTQLQEQYEQATRSH